MVTIYDIAKRAGVSAGTVSRALSRPEKVRPRTRQRIEAAAAALGYVANAAARSLRTQRSGKILITVPDITNPFFAQILQGAEEAALAAGYAVVIGDTQHRLEREERYAQVLHGQQVDGMIVLGHRPPPSLHELVNALGSAAPVVSGCEYDPTLGIPSVQIDNAAAATQAMEHLYGLGHRAIGIIGGPPDMHLHRQRLEGVRAIARTRRAIRMLRIETGDFSVESGHAAALRMLARDDRPTAVFCFSDQMALGVLAACRELCLQVPQDVSVVGFDDLSTSRFLTPPLTSVSQPMRAIGSGTVVMLLGILEGTAQATQVKLGFELMVRNSTAIAALRPGA